MCTLATWGGRARDQRLAPAASGWRIFSSIRVVSLSLTAAVFAGAGLLKLSADPEMVHRLQQLNFGSSWRWFIGSCEIIGVLALISPRTRTPALLGLWPFALGGLALHISYAHPPERLVPAALASALVPLCLFLDHQRRTLSASRASTGESA